MLENKPIEKMEGKNKRLNVLMITRAYGERAGGMERLSWELARELDKSGKVSLKLLAHRGSRATSPLFIIKGLIVGMWKARKADVIFLGDPLLSIIGWLLRKMLHKPIAITVHGLDVIYPNLFYQWYLKKLGLNFDLYLPISQYTSTLLTRLKVSGKIVVINPGVDDRYYDSSIEQNSLTKVLGVNVRGKKILLTVGRLQIRKGHEWLIRNVLPKLDKNVVYVIAGSGKEEAQIRAAVRESGMSHRVIMLGRAKVGALKVLYNTADIFVQPNIKIAGDAEGFGLVLLEASLCGLPIVASKMEGITDAIREGQNGWLVEAENEKAWSKAISIILAGSQKQIPARQFTRDHYDWTKQVEKYITALSEL